jgi:N-acetylglucosamine-6-phosphate deacetylase
MKPLRRDEIGTVGCTMLFDELYCEAICDGIHVSPPALQLLWKNKPNDKFVLVTDSLRPKYLPNGIYPEADQIIVVQDGAARLDTGRLAGSILKMNQAVKNIMDFLNIDFETAVKCASENPAKNLGVYDQMGSIKEGKLANFVVVDKDVNVYQTIRRGKVVYNKN